MYIAVAPKRLWSLCLIRSSSKPQNAKPQQRMQAWGVSVNSHSVFEVPNVYRFNLTLRTAIW